MSDHTDTPESSEPAGQTLSPAEATRLWELYRSGSNPHAVAALDQLYRCLRRPLVAFCRLKGCDPELADEVSERAWVRLLERKPRARTGFIPLLRKTAQNLWYQELRAQRTVPLCDTRTADDDPTRAIVGNDTAIALEECLDRLDPESRAFFVFVHVHGLTQKAACELLGWDIAASTAHERLERTQEQLEACLQKKSVL